MKNYEEIYEYVKNTLSEKRFYHSVCVVERAIEFAKIYKVDEEKAKYAAILHDIAKEVPKELRIKNAEKLGVVLDDVERESTGLIHAKAAAKIAEVEFGLDEEICSSISYHTTGKENMTPLEKIIYLADATGIDRYYEEAKTIYELAKKDLDEALIYSFKKSILDRIKEEKSVHFDTVKAYNFLIK